MNPLKHFITRDISKDRSIDDNHKATERNTKKYNYRYTGSAVAYGPIYAETPTEAKQKIGKVKGLEVWETR